MSSSDNQKQAHIGLVPSAGMGHLIPFLRLASSLPNHNLKVSIFTPIPTVSLSESQSLTHFFASNSQITQIPLHLPHNPTPITSQDPFYTHMHRIHHSSHLLNSLIPSLSPPLTALITDMSLTTALLPITQSLNLPNYILFSSSAQMLTLFVSYHSVMDSITADSLKIPIPVSWIPPLLLVNTENPLKSYIAENGKKMAESSGILVNTFESIERESLNMLNTGEVIKGLPKVIPIGPLPPFQPLQPNDLIGKGEELAWLERQPAGSVVYVSFGSRTAMSRDQMRGLGKGLLKSGFRFLWVVKDKKVDAEDKEGLDEIIGAGLMEKLKGNGLVTKNWVDQEEVLGHRSVGCFVSHCGWNSLIEAMWNGVRVLAWPQHGDQKINSDIVDRIGLGVWDKSWGWGGENVVKEDDIAEKITGLMGNEVLREKVFRIREEARRAVKLGGTSHKALTELINTWKIEL